MVKLSAIQISSSTNIQDNLAKISTQLAAITTSVDEADIPVEHLVVLPECCLFFGGKEHEQLNLAKETALQNTLSVALSKLAKQYSVYLVAGTIPLLATSGDKFTNSSCIYNPEGELLGRYDKIHLFDVNVNDNTKSYHESLFTQAGSDISVIQTDFAKVGLTVCFDLRFPLLFQKLTSMGAGIITIPSAFTKVTGEAHWLALLQARAIENQVYIIASGQEGIHENGRETWGHSMIINPWGKVEKCLPVGEGFISVDYQPETLEAVRESMPLKSELRTKITNRT